ncbi:MAG TPA: hypothetical protein VGN18_17515 [Jatrophihabitans sp.]|jgi:hypothetical protein|uniref:hypothetical protein n=1 Tax=Jatrophihabitans sp. TaxID=1932789 RepID=UPI002DFB03E9|nr:hypothetical protein [Jatrophihabitans sp.]
MIRGLLLAAATATPSPSSSTPSGEGAKAGPIGLAVILLLCIACYFLFKSMSKHLRTVREKFPSGEHADASTSPLTGRPAPPAGDAPPANPAAQPPPGAA